MAFRVVPPVAVCIEGVLAELARALHGVALPRQTRATQADPSPDEGLALLADYLAIKDPSLRQAVMDFAALIAAAPGD